MIGVVSTCMPPGHEEIPMPLSIHLLGPPRAERDGQPLPAPRGDKIWALLAYLLRSSAPVRRPHLSGLLFADAQDPLGALRWNLCQLRRLLGGSQLGGNPLTLTLEPDTQVDVLTLVDGGTQAAAALPGIGRDLLEGIRFPSSPAFDAWLEEERTQLRARARAVFTQAFSSLPGGA